MFCFAASGFLASSGFRLGTLSEFWGPFRSPKYDTASLMKQDPPKGKP